MDDYILYHRDVEVAVLNFSQRHHISKCDVINYDHLPFLGRDGDMLRLIDEWWSMRAVPDTRSDFISLKKTGIASGREALLKNHAVSLTDNYWVASADSDISWNGINLYKSDTHAVVFGMAGTINPNSSLGGNMPKEWISLSDGRHAIIKFPEHDDNRQLINEAFATYANEKQNVAVPFVSYGVDVKAGIPFCVCESFTDEDIEFISAYDMIKGRKNTDVSDFDYYRDLLINNGIDGEVVDECLDYQILMDFVLDNGDRHLSNMGILRNPVDLSFISVAPIFDFGNSMSYQDSHIYDKATSLEKKIAGFYEKQEKLLKRVKNKKAVSIDKLPSVSQLSDFYAGYGIPDGLIEQMKHNYDVRVSLLSDFQGGAVLSPHNYRFQKESGAQVEMDTGVIPNSTIPENISQMISEAREVIDDRS